MSFKAKGVLCYLLSKPATWTPRIGEISSIGPDGKESIQSALKELQKFGYSSLVTERGEDGRVVGKCWQVYETPSCKPEVTDEGVSPSTVKPHRAETPSTGNPATSNTLSKEETQNREKDTYLLNMGMGNLSVSAEDIYKEYPKKVGKPKALLAIKKAMKWESPERLLDATKRYAILNASCDQQFMPHPSTWFNAHRFADDESTWKIGVNGNHAKPIEPDMAECERRLAAIKAGCQPDKNYSEANV
jgi:hypothetical protein